MRNISLSVLLIFALTACGAGPGKGPTPEQRAAKKANIERTNQAVANAKSTSVDGRIFRVAVVEEKSFALVEPKNSSAPFFPGDIERAARQVTGCQSEFTAGVLAFISGDLNTLDLGKLKTKGRGWGWRADLKC